MRKLLKSFLLAGALGLTGTAQAGVFFVCDLNTRIPNGWVSPTMGFVFDDAGQVTVIDAVILHFLGDPLRATMRRRGDRNRITWNVAGARDSRGQRVPTFRYIADLNTATGAIYVSAKPLGSPQRWSARGMCQPRTDLELPDGGS